MKRKSKLLTFLLSFCPGLGHIYLGLTMRGILFLLAVFGDVLLFAILAVVDIVQDPILLVFLPFIWLVGLVDSMVLVDRVNHSQTNEIQGQTQEQIGGVEKLLVDNRKLFTILFSIIPGAGHMYLGLMQKGVQLMFAFFISFYLTDFLRTSLFMVLMPIVWFYSLFDAIQKVSSEESIQDEGWAIMEYLKEKTTSKNGAKLWGGSLIVLGMITMLNRVAAPLLNEIWDKVLDIQCISGYRITEYFRTGLVSLLLILGGIKLMVGKKERKEQ